MSSDTESIREATEWREVPRDARSQYCVIQPRTAGPPKAICLSSRGAIASMPPDRFGGYTRQFSTAKVARMRHDDAKAMARLVSAQSSLEAKVVHYTKINQHDHPGFRIRFTDIEQARNSDAAGLVARDQDIAGEAVARYPREQ